MTKVLRVLATQELLVPLHPVADTAARTGLGNQMHLPLGGAELTHAVQQWARGITNCNSPTLPGRAGVTVGGTVVAGGVVEAGGGGVVVAVARRVATNLSSQACCSVVKTGSVVLAVGGVLDAGGSDIVWHLQLTVGQRRFCWCLSLSAQLLLYAPRVSYTCLSLCACG